MTEKIIPTPKGFNWATDWWIPIMAGIVAIVLERIFIVKFPLYDIVVERFQGHI